MKKMVLKNFNRALFQTKMELEQFTKNVKDIFEVQDQIRQIAKDARERRAPLKEKADELEENVRAYMTKENINVCNYQEERLELKTVVRFGSLTKKSLEAALVLYFQNEEEAARCFEHVMESIGSREVQVLKRLKNRKRKAGDEKDDQQPSKKAAKTEENAPELSDDDDDY